MQIVHSLHMPTCCSDNSVGLEVKVLLVMLEKWRFSSFYFMLC